MDKPYHKVLQFLLGWPLAVLGFFARSYKANRDRVNKLTSSRKVKSVIQYGAIAILLAWVLIFYFAPSGSGDRLTESLQSGFGMMKSAEKNRNR